MWEGEPLDKLVQGSDSRKREERIDPRDVMEAENLGLAYHLLLYFPRL